MIGVEPSHDGLIRLMNLSTDSLTYVEPAWFRQRKIKTLPTEAEADFESRFYDEVGGYHEGGCGTGPDGVFCGECSESSCAGCPAWLRRQKGGAQLE